MEKKKSKIGKITLIIVLVIIILLAIRTIRNYMILNSMQNKVAEYTGKTNFYYKIEEDNSNISYFEVYRKNDIKKVTIIQKETGTKVMNYIYPGYTNIYEDVVNGIDTMRSQNIETFENVTIPNYINFTNHFQMLLSSLPVKIKTETIDGTEYCVLTNLYSPSYTIENRIQKVTFYFSKNTGLVEKIVETMDTGEENTILYTYEFDSVTDENLSEPDKSNYKIL